MSVLPTEEWEARVLAVDPFAGDFGDGEVLLSDRMVTAAKRHEGACNVCGGPVAKGERHRVRREAYGGRVASTRFCLLCCVAFASAADDDGRAWEARVDLHRGKAA